MNILRSGGFWLWVLALALLNQGAGASPDPTTPTVPGEESEDQKSEKEEKREPVELNLKDKKETDKYNCNKSSKTTTFTAKAGYCFNKLLGKKGGCCSGDTILWEAEYMSEYCVKVELQDLGSSKLNLSLYPTNNTRKTFHKPGKREPWQETTPLKVTISTLDSNDNKKTNINDSSHFNLKEQTEGLYKCTFKKDVRCVEFKVNDKSVWKYNDEEHGNHYPKEIIFKLNETCVKIVNLILKFVYKNDKWNLVNKTLFEPTTNKVFTFVTSNKEDGSNTSENNASHYVTTQSNERFILILEEKVKLLELKYDNETVWKHDSDIYEDLYPGSFIHKPGDFLSINFDPYYYTYKLNSTSDKWVLNDALSHKGALPLTVSEHPSYITVITKDPSDNTKTKENDTSQYKVFSPSDGMYLYAFKDGVKFVEVRYKTYSIWTHDGIGQQVKLPKTISVDTHGPIFEIEFEDKTLGFKLTDEGIINYTVKNDKTQYSKMLSFVKDSGSGGGLTSRRPGSFTTGSPTSPSSGSSSYRTPPPVPSGASQGSGSKYKPPPAPPPTPSTPETPTKKEEEDAKDTKPAGTVSVAPKISPAKPSTPTPRSGGSTPKVESSVPRVSTPSTPGQDTTPEAEDSKPAGTKESKDPGTKVEEAKPKGQDPTQKLSNDSQSPRTPTNQTQKDSTKTSATPSSTSTPTPKTGTAGPKDSKINSQPNKDAKDQVKAPTVTNSDSKDSSQSRISSTPSTPKNPVTQSTPKSTGSSQPKESGQPKSSTPAKPATTGTAGNGKSPGNSSQSSGSGTGTPMKSPGITTAK